MTFKVPAKYVDKEFRELGAKVTSRQEAAVYYTFPDGTTLAVRRRLDRETAIRIVKDAHCRFPDARRRRDAIVGDTVRGPKPVIDLARLEASTHAQERLALMRQQAPIEWSEIVAALTTPDRVVYSDFHESWTWVGTRIAVCVVVTPHRQIIATILWADADLWAQHPRPESAG